MRFIIHCYPILAYSIYQSSHLLPHYMDLMHILYHVAPFFVLSDEPFFNVGFFFFFFPPTAKLKSIWHLEFR